MREHVETDEQPREWKRRGFLTLLAGLPAIRRMAYRSPREVFVAHLDGIPLPPVTAFDDVGGFLVPPEMAEVLGLVEREDA